MTPAKRFDQLNLARQMIRVERADAMQFIQQFLGDQLGRGMLHAVDHPVSHCLHRSEADLFFEPVEEQSRRRPVVGGSDVAAVMLSGSRR